MPVDYSKWDALELSDDSDIEVHPNVDKRSFIRAKQNQIHQDRYQRKHEIATLKYERIINDGFLQRIEGLLKALRTHQAEAASRNPDELMFLSVMESAPEDSSADTPPPRPEGVHSGEAEVPSYSKMMATLVDQVKKEVDTQSGNRFDAYVAQVIEHQKKVTTLQGQLATRLSELEKIEGSKITSESYSTGFDRSAVSKAAPPPPLSTTTAPKQKVKAVEVLNPHVMNNNTTTDSSGADADVDEPPAVAEDDDEDDVEPSDLGKAFAALPNKDYRAYLNFISQHPSVLAERETDGLLVLGFNAQMKGKEEFALQCVHQALLLQYCRSLGKDGVGLFFKRITTQGHQAQQVFIKDVHETYQRIRMRVKELAKQREEEDPDQNGGVEQIQLHAVEPGTSINISIPPENSEDEATRNTRSVFESFSPGLRRALESGSLDEVNKVLGKMSVEEAEEVVEQLGECGMLSMQEGVIDATTEEGQAALKEFEAQERAAAAERRANEPAGDPE